MQPWISVLLRPYPFTSRQITIVRQALLFGTFIFLFLFLLQPFQLGRLGDRLWKIALGYAGITTATMMILNLTLLKSAHFLPHEAKWNVLKEALWTLLNIFCIIAGNLIYSVAQGFVTLDISALLLFTFYTAAVGIFPVFIGIVWKEFRLRKHFEQDANTLNHDIQSTQISPAPKLQILIPADNPKHSLLTDIDAIICISAAENYVEVYRIHLDKVQKYLIRNTLTAVATYLENESPLFFRCHKSHIVNMQHVRKVSGNAQGYKLHLQHLPDPLPVSRQHTKTLHLRLPKPQ
jgi:hypothetical protein